MAKGSGNTRGNAPGANPQLKGVGNTEKQTEHPFVSNFNWDGESKKIIMEKGGYSQEDADKIFTDIRVWAGAGYEGIRGWQLDRNEDDYFASKAERLEDFIEHMPKWHGGTTYRGLPREKREFFEKMDVGDQWDARSLNSWTSSEEVGKSFSGSGKRDPGGVILRCSKPQNGTSIAYAALRGEDEVLVSGKARYRCTNKSYDDIGRLIIDLEPISNGKVRKR